MTDVPFVHSTALWDESIAPAGPLIAFSELPRGRCPVVTGTFTINYVIEGTERYLIGGRETQVSAGELLLIEPGTCATATLAGSGVTRGISIYLPVRERGMSAIDQGLMQGFRSRADRSPLGPLLIALRDRLAIEPRLGPLQTDRSVAAVSSAFDVTVRQLADQAMRIDAARPDTRRRRLQQVHNARDYLLSHLRRAVPLAELAGEVGMSQFHLARCFAAVYGSPPSQFHSAARIAAAADELERELADVTELAAKFGFSDRSSFARAFRRETGRYPAAWRRKSQAGS